MLSPSLTSRLCRWVSRSQVQTLSAVCLVLVLRASRHQYCRYYPRNNYHTLSLAESEYRGIELGLLIFNIQNKSILIILQILYHKRMDGMNEVQINCQLSIFHVCNASTWHCDCVMLSKM